MGLDTLGKILDPWKLNTPSFIPWTSLLWRLRYGLGYDLSGFNRSTVDLKPIDSSPSEETRFDHLGTVALLPGGPTNIAELTTTWTAKNWLVSANEM
jgi:hypothetical protein